MELSMSQLCCSWMSMLKAHAYSLASEKANEYAANEYHLVRPSHRFPVAHANIGSSCHIYKRGSENTDNEQAAPRNNENWVCYRNFKELCQADTKKTKNENNVGSHHLVPRPSLKARHKWNAKGDDSANKFH